MKGGVVASCGDWGEGGRKEKVMFCCDVDVAVACWGYR